MNKRTTVRRYFDAGERLEALEMSGRTRHKRASLLRYGMRLLVAEWSDLRNSGRSFNLSSILPRDLYTNVQRFPVSDEQQAA